MSIRRSGTCLNRGCYEDVIGKSYYCSDKCEQENKAKEARDKQVKENIKKIKSGKSFYDKSNPPECALEGCHVKVTWCDSKWHEFCSPEHTKLGHFFSPRLYSKRIILNMAKPEPDQE